MPKPLTSLAAVASASGASLAEIRELNPHILRGATPPDVPMWVRIPPRTGEGYDERFDALDPMLRVAVLRMQSRKGESMTSIAQKHGITARQLGWFNPRAEKLKSGNLRAGQIILMPTRATLSAAFDVPNPSIEKYPKRAKVRAKKPAARASTTKSATAKSSRPVKPATKSTRTIRAKTTSKKLSSPSKSTTSAPAARSPCNDDIIVPH